MKRSISLAFFLVVAAHSTFCAVFDITSYGAVGDGQTDNTKAFDATIAACASAGGGQVVVPAGTFLTLPFTISSPMDFYLSEGAVILAHSNPYDWPPKAPCFICVSEASGGSFTGFGKIEGQGALWWANLSLVRPYLLEISHSNHFLISDATFIDAPCFNVVIQDSDFVEVRNVTILAPPSPISHNTDGIDPSNSNNLWIHDCYIDNGDDNVAIKEDCSNITVENCIFGHGHGASIGSVIGGTNENITFRNISFTNTTAGVRIKTQPGCTGTVKDIVYENLQMKNVDDLIVIDMDYQPGCGSKLTGINVTNVRVENVYGSGIHVGYFNCSKYMPCTDITLLNINIFGNNSNEFWCNNAFGTATNVQPQSCLLSS